MFNASETPSPVESASHNNLKHYLLEKLLNTDQDKIQTDHFVSQSPEGKEDATSETGTYTIEDKVDEAAKISLQAEVHNSYKILLL